MAAGTKGTQTLAGLANKPAWLLRSQAQQAQSLERQRTANEAAMSAQGFTQKTDLGNGMMQYTRPNAGGSVGSSFGKMMGGSPRMGGGMGMAGLEAASMRLADAASKRNIQESEAKFSMERAAQVQDYKIQQKEREIEKLERAIENVGPGINRGAVQESYRQKIQGLKSEIENLLTRK